MITALTMYLLSKGNNSYKASDSTIGIYVCIYIGLCALAFNQDLALIKLLYKLAI